MRMEVRSFQVPRWLAPLLVLVALAFIPIALMFAVALGVLAVGTTMIRAFLPSSQSTPVSHQRSVFSSLESKKSDVSAIDVEYEVKDSHEKI
jgi:hypothetical protein